MLYMGRLTTTVPMEFIVKSVVLYHFPSLDGAFAAWAAKFAALSNLHEIVMIPHSDVRRISSLVALKNKFYCADTLYLMDYAGPNASFIIQCCANFTRVVLMDRHGTTRKTIQEMPIVPKNLTFSVDWSHASCVHALNHFRVAGIVLPASMRELCYHIEDSALCAQNRPLSEFVVAGLESLELSWDFEKDPNLYTRMRNLDVESLIELGRKTLKERDAYIDEIVKHRYVIEIGTFICLAVNSRYPKHIDQVALTLADQNIYSGLGGVCHLLEDGRWRVALRSIFARHGVGYQVDVADIAKNFGGGGTFEAAGFTVDQDTWNTMIKTNFIF